MNKDYRFCSIAEVVEMLELSGRCETLYTGGYGTACLRKVRMGKRKTVWVRAQVLRHVDLLTTEGECGGKCKLALEETAQWPLHAVK